MRSASDRGPSGPTTVFAGVPIDDVTLEDAVERCCELVEAGRATGGTHQVTTVNVEFVLTARRDPSVRRILQWADLAVPDGMPIVWASHLLGTRIRQRVAGADLVPALASCAARRGYRLYLFGSAPGVAERAATLLSAEHPGAVVVGAGGTTFTDVADMDPSALADIVAAKPDIVCVALGHPKQERWIDAYREQVGAPVLVGVGGSLDFLVGGKRRAPSWMQRSGLEWLHRAVTEPRRLGRRYARDLLRFPSLVLREVLVAPVHASGTAVLDGRCVQEGASTLVDLSGVTRLDRAAVGSLVERARRDRAHGGQLLLRGLSPGARRSLRAMGVEQYFPTATEAEVADAAGNVTTSAPARSRPRSPVPVAAFARMLGITSRAGRAIDHTRTS